MTKSIDNCHYHKKESQAIKDRLNSLGYELCVQVDLYLMEVKIEDPGVAGFFYDYDKFYELSDKEMKTILESIFDYGRHSRISRND